MAHPTLWDTWGGIALGLLLKIVSRIFKVARRAQESTTPHKPQGAPWMPGDILGEELGTQK